MPVTSAETAATMWSAICGFFAPLLIAVVLQCHWPSLVKRIASFMVYVLIAIGAEYWSGTLGSAAWQLTALTIIYTAVTGYTGRQVLWKEVTDKIEDATTPGVS